MPDTDKKVRVHVLSSRDTQRWHSPWSVDLRRWRRSRIMDQCMRSTRDHGFSEYVIYDAFENYLARGEVA